MANEAVVVVKIENAIPYVVADGAGIAKGTLCKLSDGRVAVASTAINDKIAGIAAREKVISDGRTELGIYMRCIARMTLSGTVTVGDAVASASDANWPNYVYSAAITCSGANIIGHALQSGTVGQEKLIYVNVGAGGNQQS